ncbi:MAG: dienelactone hydrolase family protein [Chloroflexi bacterium]|nr:dienelactone hydrolase family protein [Chloroflexota bacterium]
MTVTGYEAVPAGGKKGPGVVALHAWWGLNVFFKEVCDRLAGEGFVVFAPDLYHGTVATTIEEAENLSSTLNHEVANQEMVASVEYLQQHPAVTSPALGAVGFSLGAFLALRLAQNRPQDVAAVVLFYGTGDGEYDRTQAAFLGHFADNDPFEPTEVVQQLKNTLRELGREVEFHTYPGTGHWFFEQDRPDAYHADAAHAAWERTVAFLRRKLQ